MVLRHQAKKAQTHVARKPRRLRLTRRGSYRRRSPRESTCCPKRAPMRICFFEQTEKGMIATMEPLRKGQPNSNSFALSKEMGNRRVFGRSRGERECKGRAVGLRFLSLAVAFFPG